MCTQTTAAINSARLTENKIAIIWHSEECRVFDALVRSLNFLGFAVTPKTFEVDAAALPHDARARVLRAYDNAGAVAPVVEIEGRFFMARDVVRAESASELFASQLSEKN
jgi:hypothetical protein